MGPTWIVVVVRSDGETSAEVFDDEEDARAAYEQARKVPGRKTYLATARAEAHS